MNPKQAAYRCEECGRLSHAVLFRGDAEPTPIACPDHPAATMLIWNNALQSGVNYLHQCALGGFEPDPAAIDPLCLALFEKWGKTLPERNAPAAGPASPAGLFG